MPKAAHLNEYRVKTVNLSFLELMNSFGSLIKAMVRILQKMHICNFKDNFRRLMDPLSLSMLMNPKFKSLC